MKKTIPFAMIAVFIVGCASDKPIKTSAEISYDTAIRKLGKGNYSAATLELQDFSTKHPYSKFSSQVELLRLFAAYKNREFILSETLSETFIERHPRHPSVDYAKYMLAMSHYRQSSSAEKDPEQTTKAIEGFKRLLKEHPESPYAKDGANRLQRLFNKLAEHELNIGKFYFDKKRYVAAANRFQVIIEKYQTTSAIEEGLYWLAASFDRLGIVDNARQTAQLLKYNYPKSEWSRKAARFL